jgi:galactose mutarotase-like enzyme
MPSLTQCRVLVKSEYRGIEATVFENKDLRIVVLHGKGTDISEITYKPLGMNLLFRNPWGPRSPLLFPNVSPHEEMFRDYTGGGWSDVIPNAGSPCTAVGASFGLHDETPLLEWSARAKENSRERASAVFEVELKKYPFRIKKDITVDSQNRIIIVETIENASKQALPFSWVSHPTFSWDFVGKGAKLDLSAQGVTRMEGGRHVWRFPNFLDYDGARRDVTVIPTGDRILDGTIVLSGLSEGRYAITNERLGLEFELTWDKRVFPYLWYYRSINAQNYPYFGRSRFIALEPCTSRFSGLANQIREADAPMLKPGEKLTTTMTAKVRARKR